MLVAPKPNVRMPALEFGLDHAYRLSVGVFIIVAVFLLPCAVAMNAIRSRDAYSLIFALLLVTFSVVLCLALFREIM